MVSSSLSQSQSQSPFTTPSDIVRHLNSALSALEDKEKEKDQSPSQPSPPPHHFELQRKFSSHDDSSYARRATVAETKAFDFSSKLQQTLHHVPDQNDRQEFIETQLLPHGNHLYRQGLLEDAMDVYLTCLTGVIVQRKENDEKNNKEIINEKKEEDTTDFPMNKTIEKSNMKLHLPLLSRILHNLAQSALQLQWYGKCIRFASMALEYLQLEEQEEENEEKNHRSSTHEGRSYSNSKVDSDDCESCQHMYAAKLYYKRGKAYRLTGHYRQAYHDLRQAQTWLQKLESQSQSKSPSSLVLFIGNDNCITTTATTTVRPLSPKEDNESTPYQSQSQSQLVKQQQLKHVDKEFRLLAHAVQQGHQNRRRQHEAMKQVMTLTGKPSSSSSSASSSTVPSNSTLHPNASNINHSCSNIDPINTKHKPQPQQRPYSTLHAPRYYSKILSQHRNMNAGAGTTTNNKNKNNNSNNVADTEKDDVVHGNYRMTPPIDSMLVNIITVIIIIVSAALYWLFRSLFLTMNT